MNPSAGLALPCARRPPRNAWLYALPDGRLPPAVTCGGCRYEHIETFKHDFFAATGLYRGPGGLAVLKLGRTNPLFSVPVDSLGALLARHEIKLYAAAQDLRGVPRLIGAVGRTGFLHAFVPGHPLRRREPVGEHFFDELQELLAGLHARHIAYVDLNKRENILVGDDGRPHLIDFQISLWLPPTGWRGLRPVRWLLRRFQQADEYHVLKHKRRSRPEQLTPGETERVSRLSVWIRLHRLVARPLTYLRRQILRRLAAESDGVAGAGAK